MLTIMVSRSSGQFLAAFDTHGKGLEYGTDIAFNPANKKLYVTDRIKHCIQVLNSDLTFSGNFGKHGSGKGKFNSPLALPVTELERCTWLTDSTIAFKSSCTQGGRFVRKV